MCVSGDARKSKVTFLLFTHLSKGLFGFFFPIAKENITCYFCGLYFNQAGSSEKGKQDVSLYVQLLSCGKN